jgi:4-hydroxy-tetrahydrodipicolinate synthase
MSTSPSDPSAVARLRGSIVPVVTPFASGAVDEAAFGRLVDGQIEAGSHGVLVTGTSGEPSTLTIDERARLVEVAVAAAAGRVPIVAATGSQSLRETLELTERATAAGADAVLVVTPYYIKPPQAGLVAYLAEVARSTPLPFLVYHIPGRAGVTLAPASMAELVERCPTVVGMKHASTDIGYVATVLDLVPDLRVFCGLEELGLPMLAVGAVGTMNAVGNLAPAIVAELCQAMDDGDLKRARELHMQLLELNRAVFWETNPIPIKYLMRQLGLLTDNEHRLPMRSAGPELAARLDALLDRTPWLRP